MIHPIKSLQARIQTRQSKCFEKTRSGKKLRKYRDRHRGETCFFIGNGPSLRAQDLTAIKEAGYPTFAFNRIFHIFDSTQWRPTYYISQDEKMLAGCEDEVNRLELPTKFIPVNMRWHFNINIDGAEEFYLGGSKDREFWFGDDIAHSVCWASTVMYTAAQFAAYMGFKRIVLIGVDHHFHISRNRDGEIIVDDTVKDYFTDKYNPDLDKLDIPSTDISTDTYYAMKKHCDERGIEVLNATRGGKLEVFPRADAEIFFKTKNQGDAE